MTPITLTAAFIAGVAVCLACVALDRLVWDSLATDAADWEGE